MKKTKVDKNAFHGLDLPELEQIRKRMASDPSLEERLKKDFHGTLKKEGIKVDSAFRDKVMEKLNSKVRADLREIVAKRPEAKNWYLKRILEGKPLKIHVHIDKETGRCEKSLGGGG
ncbi:MAG: hypothetical protein ABC559_01705 [Candidatus Methanosuratincola petrocarbonis]